MLKEKFFYAVILAVVLAGFFVIGNPTHAGTLTTFPHAIGILAFPVVLTIQLRLAYNENSSLSFADAFRLTQWTVLVAALLFGDVVLVYGYFCFYAPSAWLLGMSLLSTILVTSLVGTVFSLLCALGLTKMARRQRA